MCELQCLGNYTVFCSFDVGFVERVVLWIFYASVSTRENENNGEFQPKELKR